MKKLILLLSLYVSVVNAQNVNIPDANFKNALLNHDPVIDTNDDDEISVAEAEDFTGTIIVSNENISDLTGIEAFINIVVLSCNNNQLPSLDVSNNINLTSLNCRVNQLSSLDVSNNTSLTYLWCSANQLSSLDVSNNTALTELDFSTNQLSSLDVSNNTTLTRLSCAGNQLTSLDVSNNLALTDFFCGRNQLSSLDVSNNTSLFWLHCKENENLTCIKVIDENNIPSSFTKDNSAVWSEDCQALSSNKELENTSFTAYPNPVNNRLSITSKTNASYSLVSVLGKVEAKGNLTTGNNTIDVSKLAKGIYILNIITAKGHEALKVVKE